MKEFTELICELTLIVGLHARGICSKRSRKRAKDALEKFKLIYESVSKKEQKNE